MFTEEEVNTLKDYFNGDYDGKLPSHLQEAVDDFKKDYDVTEMPKITVLPVDDPWKAMKGYIAFYETSCNDEGDNQERTMVFMWQFAADVINITTLAVGSINERWSDRDQYDEDIKRAEKELKRVLDEGGWVKADDPKNLTLGMIKYVPVGQGVSEGIKMNISLFKALGNDELRARYQAWRDAQPGYDQIPI